MTPEQSQRYDGLMHAVAAQTVAAIKWSVPAATVARMIAEAVTARSPRPRYTVGWDAGLVTCMARILSDRMLDRVFAAALCPHVAVQNP